MRLLQVTLMTPIRDEKQIIYKWEEREVLLNPRNIESVGWVEEIGKAQILLTSGRCVPIKESLEQFSNMFTQAYRKSSE